MWEDCDETHEEQEGWFLGEIAELALSDPVRALKVIGPPVRYLDGTYLRVACDLLEMAARRLRDGTFDFQAFSCVVDASPEEARSAVGGVPEEDVAVTSRSQTHGASCGLL